MKSICIIWSWSGIWKALSEYYAQGTSHLRCYTRWDYDLKKPEDVEKLAYELSRSNFDLVIFAAGVWYRREFYDLSSENISQQVLVNTLAPLMLLKSVNRKTKFVYLSSIMQYISPKNMSVYAASKRSVSQVLEALGSKDILSVDLWAVKTPMHLKAWMPKMVWKDMEVVLPKLVNAIDHSYGRKTLFWDWWCMVYIVFPLIRLVWIIKK